MQKNDYQEPKIYVLTFDAQDVIRTSPISTPNSDFDQGVEDFF